MKFYNEEYLDSINSNDLFVCSFSSETRSVGLFEYALKFIPKENIIVFSFDNLVRLNKDVQIVAGSIATHSINYRNWDEAISIIVKKYDSMPGSVNIHIDYSSMPRGWYTRMPERIVPNLRKGDKLFFWYTEVDVYHSVPNAGISGWYLFSGKPTIRPDNKRVHIFSLGFDSIRTQAITNKLDPDAYITCYAFDPRNPSIREKVEEQNDDIISNAIMSIAFHINDFELMVARLCEISNELHYDGDVILVPDGPKPLIFAMSLVPIILEKRGITCIHFNRNLSNERGFIDTQSSDRVIGFSITSSK